MVFRALEPVLGRHRTANTPEKADHTPAQYLFNTPETEPKTYPIHKKENRKRVSTGISLPVKTLTQVTPDRYPTNCFWRWVYTHTPKNQLPDQQVWLGADPRVESPTFPNYVRTYTNHRTLGSVWLPGATKVAGRRPGTNVQVAD